MKDKNKTTAGVLAIVLGAFGAQYFYLGNTRKAVTRLLLSLFVPVCAMVFEIMGIVDGIRMLSMSDQEFAERFYELRGEVDDDEANEPVDVSAEGDQKEPNGETAPAKQKAATPSGYMEQFEVLRTYKDLLDSGAITETEFAAIKSSVMRW